MLNQNQIRFLLILSFLQLISSKKHAECFMKSSKQSGISGYIRFDQETRTSPVIFNTFIYGTDEIVGIKIHQNPDYSNDCNNIGDPLYSLIFTNPEKLKTPSEIITLNGFINGLSLYEEDRFSNMSCSILYKSSRLNKIHNLYDHESIKIGSCGILQIYDYRICLTMGLILMFFIIILVIRYFKNNKP